MPKEKGLARVARLYARVEQMRLIEMQRTVAERNDAQCAIALEAMVRQGYYASEREALALGDPVSWQISTTAGEVAERALMQLNAVLLEREARLEEAEAAHQASRLQWKQVQRVVEQSEATAAVHEGRCAQAAADDHFASRRDHSMKHR